MQKRPTPASEPSKKTGISTLIFGLIGSLIVFSPIIFLGYKLSQFSSGNKVTKDSFTIGIITSSKAYKSLRNHLEKELIVNDFWRFVKGDRVTITIDGDKKLKYEEARARIVKKDWDIVFTLSPMNSVAAKNNGYFYSARMFPDNPPFYQSALFVKSNSPINSISDLQPKTVIAMGEIASASSFFMPSYDLYGKILTVSRDHRGSDIIEMVKSGKADIGSVAFSDSIRTDPEIRIIQTSRNIPGAGVYLSPNISEQDRQAISKVLLNSPKDIQKEANYGDGEEPDYSALVKIVERVEEVLSCSDFSKNPVIFYCPDSKLTEKTADGKNLSPKKFVGQINGYKVPTTNVVWLNVEDQEKLIYRVIISKTIISKVTNVGSLLNLQNKKIEINNAIINKSSDGVFEIVVTNAEQFRVF